MKGSICYNSGKRVKFSTVDVGQLFTLHGAVWMKVNPFGAESHNVLLVFPQDAGYFPSLRVGPNAPCMIVTHARFAVGPRPEPASGCVFATGDPVAVRCEPRTFFGRVVKYHTVEGTQEPVVEVSMAVGGSILIVEDELFLCDEPEGYAPVETFMTDVEDGDDIPEECNHG
ncbi:hypothetical protein BcepSauron_446 [Burkholderia phage BcepSauron]|uniref:Uncharacterized protein n=2 Tax=Sarumanvirus TaxID=2843450 RepID=A0A482MMW5_9CAUD|nr:hypothetical protein H1O16_gp444 [Burkholderia phage BcepSaruman]YP_009904824.1 hypothetical protein H1O17_gp446 [Burkholderia phage BcepSauron]QBQ74826.1 hypothetical protein BcepSauron_446 [Burkholderia phage BcepSauron]QBX06857.1 hypothetical protein BcepSaruman_444 [Burkholderia phage BcepSaruman]